MKLEEAQLRDKVPTGAGPGDMTNRLSVAMKWELEADMDKRVIFAARLDHRIVVPFENTSHMTPLRVAAVAEAKGKRVA